MVVEVIDVTAWLGDEHHAVFPVGARDKEMLWSPELVEAEGLKTNWPYLFKESIYRYPDQYWTELVAYIVSKHLGVDVPKVLPAIKVTEEGIVCGSLIEWFYDVETERFMHAGSYFKRLIPDFDDKTGKQHNLTDMNLFIRGLSMYAGLTTSRMHWIADMALFDSLIGNTDRHQENWGVVFQSDKKSRLSPLFDNGTSLGHERYLDKVRGWDKNRIETYVRKGRHHLRISKDDTKTRIPHFELVKGVVSADEDIKEYVEQKLANLDLEGMLAEIEDLTALQIDVPFTRERFDWIKKNLVARLKLIKEEIRNDYD
ncbi:HipA domain-containing protein [Vibrio harveyi]|uniref:HipA domain-containing protein n=1 Tax=Vibrio harveyi TaxID=669 RepID=UPI0027E7D3E9|nr:HipA domain-containing protein [Vibrio harveyi]